MGEMTPCSSSKLSKPRTSSSHRLLVPQPGPPRTHFPSESCCPTPYPSVHDTRPRRHSVSRGSAPTLTVRSFQHPTLLLGELDPLSFLRWVGPRSEDGTQGSLVKGEDPNVSLWSVPTRPDPKLHCREKRKTKRHSFPSWNQCPTTTPNIGLASP